MTTANHCPSIDLIDLWLVRDVRAYEGHIENCMEQLETVQEDPQVFMTVALSFE